ncbi:hypothetical protein ABH926_009953 [Catenulispora sp. GP43]|uniref:hypothetical protein n=1 Tax=Catenulispora sp. GP43 TaxID=3156263 RepID=UPI003519A018
MTPYAPLPTGSTAADLLAWWRQRARTDRVATGYYTTCRMALAELGPEARLREINALTLHADDLVRLAVDGCWFGLSEPSRHHHTLRLRRALGLFSAALGMQGSAPATTSRPDTRSAPTPPPNPIVVDNAEGYDTAGASPELIAYLASDEAVISAAIAALDAAALEAASTSTENLAVLSAAVSAFEAALAEAGVASARIPAAAAALIAYIYRNASSPDAQ